MIQNGEFQKYFQKHSEIEAPKWLKFHKSSTVWVESEWNGGVWGGNVLKQRSDQKVAPDVRIALFYKAFRGGYNVFG